MLSHKNDKLGGKGNHGELSKGARGRASCVKFRCMAKGWSVWEYLH